MYFIVAGSILNTRVLWARFWQLSLGVSAVVGIGALFELGEGVTRIAGTTGNPIYLAVYALFHVFIAVLLLYREDSRLWRGAYGLLALLNISVIWFTGTRGSLLGLLGGIFVSALGILIFARSREDKWSRKIGLLIAGGVVILGATFFIIKDTEVAQNSVMLNRLSEASSLAENDRSTGALRIMVWKVALEGALERPILGWGQENFNYVFNKYYNPNMYWAEQWYDRTHNILLDWLIAAGVLGLLSYVGMYIIICKEAIRIRYFDSVEKSILTGLLIAYGVHNLFVFDHLLSYILFFSLAAWVHSAEVMEGVIQESIQKPLQGKGARTVAIIIIGFCVVTGAYIINYPAYAQNTKILQALISANAGAGSIDEARTEFLEAAQYTTMGTQEAREQFIQVASRIATLDSISLKEKEVFVNAALGEMQLQMQEYPEDARFPYLTAGVLTAYGRHDLSAPLLEKALELSPNKVSFLVVLGSNAALRGEFIIAREYYNRAQVLAPDNAEIQALLQTLP
jgi:O-antigen ligase